MNFTVFTEGNKGVNKDLTNGEQKQESITSTLEKQCENKGYLELDTNIDFLTPKINITIHLLKEENKVKEYKLSVKNNNERAFRVYEVENLVIGKPIEYLYKNTILNIIKNKVLQHIPKELHQLKENNIVKVYKDELDKILQNS